MELSLGFSPCPNDTFIFDALVNKKIDTQGIDFIVQLEDVQTLNNLARGGNLDISKISYGVLPLVLNEYIVLNSGGALGVGVGPLLIAKNEIQNIQEKDFRVAIPGNTTTAQERLSSDALLLRPTTTKCLIQRYVIGYPVCVGVD